MTDFATISSRYQKDKDQSIRSHNLELLARVLDGTFYDRLPHRFYEEYDGSQRYIPLKNRSPAVRYGLSLLRLAVDQSVSFTFGEGRFPSIDCNDEDVRNICADIVKECRLVQVMRDAAIRGSIGSVAIQMRVLNHRVFFAVLDTINLTPTYDPMEPDRLVKVTEKYKIKGRDLADIGYDIDEEDFNATFWFQRIFDEQAENWYLPWPVVSTDKPVIRIDDDRSVTHNLGFCPFVWVKNLPGHDDDVDGCSTFKRSLDTAIMIDYQLSQADRALKFSADPMLVISDAAIDTNGLVRSASNALALGKDGNAKFLEINGTAAQAQIKFTSKLREMLLEVIGGNRSNADRISAAQSGRAMELLYTPIILIADNLRQSYGEDGLLPLLRMVLKASARNGIKVMGQMFTSPVDPRLSLRWPHYFAQTPHDLSLQAAALPQLREGGIMSQETAVKVASHPYDVEDVGAEIDKIKSDQAEEDARAMALAAQTKATLSLAE